MRIVVWLLLISSAQIVSAQDVSVSAGGITFLGDLGGQKGVGKTFIKDLQFNKVHSVFGIYVGRSFPSFSIGANFYKGRISGSDKIENQGGAEVFRIQRNLDFQSDLYELTVLGQKYFGQSVVRPSICIGAGLLHFNPMTEYNKQVVKLKNLQTEGVDYSLLQPVIIYGGGINYAMSENLSLQFDIRARKVFTDYLDDVSTNYVNQNPIANRGSFPIGEQRGDPKDKDSYITSTVSIIFSGLFKRDYLRCPMKMN